MLSDLFLFFGGYPLFDFIRKMFSKGSESVEFEPEFQTKPCRSCGRPISYNLEWEHIPNYCRECKKEYQKDTITRTCKRCGKTFSLPSSVQHWPNYCQECRARFRTVEMITRTCRGCGSSFSFPSTVQHWPHYCRECQAKRKKGSSDRSLDRRSSSLSSDPGFVP